MTPRVGQLYRHFKGGLYRVVCVAMRCDADNGGLFVSYVNDESPSEEDASVWCRPLSDWDAIVPFDGIKGGMPRFTLAVCQSKCSLDREQDRCVGCGRTLQDIRDAGLRLARNVAKIGDAHPGPWVVTNTRPINGRVKFL